MSEGKITLSKEYLELLLEYTYIGYYLKNSNNLEIDENAERFIKTFIELIHENKLIDGINFNSNDKSFYLDDEKKEVYASSVHKYLENSIFQELSTKLAERDIEKDLGIDYIEQMENSKYFLLLQEKEENYRNEFEESGFKSLIISKY